MGNPDLCIVFNNGEVAFLLPGLKYDTRGMALTWAVYQWEEYKKEVYEIADKPEELNLEIRSINIYEIIKGV
jgi:hypothetical protein